jgi:hypothetical protein
VQCLTRLRRHVTQDSVTSFNLHDDSRQRLTESGTAAVRHAGSRGSETIRYFCTASGRTKTASPRSLISTGLRPRAAVAAAEQRSPTGCRARRRARTSISRSRATPISPSEWATTRRTCASR